MSWLLSITVSSRFVSWTLSRSEYMNNKANKYIWYIFIYMKHCSCLSCYSNRSVKFKWDLDIILQYDFNKQCKSCLCNLFWEIAIIDNSINLSRKLFTAKENIIPFSPTSFIRKKYHYKSSSAYYSLQK